MRLVAGILGRPWLYNLAGDWLTYDDLFAKFCETVEDIGGIAEVVADLPAADMFLPESTLFSASASRLSLVEGVGDSTFDFASTETPHEFSKLDLAVFAGDFGVAESGAI